MYLSLDLKMMKRKTVQHKVNVPQTKTSIIAESMKKSLKLNITLELQQDGKFKKRVLS